MNYRYHLLKYAGPSTRWTCPQCGRKHCFAPYVDKDNHPAGEEYGRCDHESSCGYVKYPPTEDESWRRAPDWNRYRNTRPQSLSLKRPEPVKEPAEGYCTLPQDIVLKTVRTNPLSDFLYFLTTLFDNQTILRLVREYFIGVTKDGDAIFYQVDIKGRIRGGKIMKYNRETGHRVKDPTAKNPVNWVHVPMLRKGLLPEGWTMTQCLFGEHLLAAYPEKVVCLVEAEKTAVICAGFLPEFLWLATGGKGQLGDRLDALYGRRVIAYPDVDAFADWSAKLKERPWLSILVSDYLETTATEEERNSGADIADRLIAWSRIEDLPPDNTPIHPIQAIQAATESFAFRTASQYVSPEYHDELRALIDDLSLEVKSIAYIKPQEQNNES